VENYTSVFRINLIYVCGFYVGFRINLNILPEFYYKAVSVAKREKRKASSDIELRKLSQKHKKGCISL
jgi:hypothetical protein